MGDCLGEINKRMLNRFVSDAFLSFPPYHSHFLFLPQQCPAKLPPPLVKLVKPHQNLVAPLVSKSSLRRRPPPRRPQPSLGRKRPTRRAPIRKESPNLLAGQSERLPKDLTAQQRTRKHLHPKRFVYPPFLHSEV